MVCLSCVCYFVSSSLFLCCLLNFHPGHEKKRTQNGVCIKACKMGGRGRRNRTGTLRLGLLLSTVGNCLNVCNVQRRALHFASLVIWFDGLIGLDGCTHLVDTFLYLFLMWLVLFVCLFVQQVWRVVEVKERVCTLVWKFAERLTLFLCVSCSCHAVTIFLSTLCRDFTITPPFSCFDSALMSVLACLFVSVSAGSSVTVEYRLAFWWLEGDVNNRDVDQEGYFQYDLNQK